MQGGPSELAVKLGWIGVTRRLGVHCLMRMSAKSLSIIRLGVKDLGITGLGLYCCKVSFQQGPL